MTTSYSLARLAHDLISAPSLSPATRRSYEATLMPFIAHFTSRTASSLTRKEIEEYLTSLSHLSLKTHHRHQTIITRLFNFGIEREICTLNPAARIRKRKPIKERGEHTSDEEVIYLSPEQLKELFRVVRYTPRLNALVTLLYESGARISEVLALNQEDIDYTNRRFLVVGKGNKKRWCYFGERSEVALKRYETQRERPHEALFTDRYKRTQAIHRLSYRSAHQDFASVIMGHDGLKTITFHQLRHTFATERANLVPLEVLRALLGHESIQTTLIYQKITSSVAQKAAHEALETLNS